MSSSDNKESLFSIDFDIDIPITIEVKHQNSRSQEINIEPGDKHPVFF